MRSMSFSVANALALAFDLHLDVERRVFRAEDNWHAGHTFSADQADLRLASAIHGHDGNHPALREMNGLHGAVRHLQAGAELQTDTLKKKAGSERDAAQS